MISWLTRLCSKPARKQYKDYQITSTYRSLATAIGLGMSAMGLGDPHVKWGGRLISVHDPELYHLLDEWEEAYASLGYRIIPLQDWIDHGGWGVDIEHLWLVKRKEGERPQFTKFEPRCELPTPSELLREIED